MPGIYLHIPFCKQACHYCNFHFSTSLKFKSELLEALDNEIKLSADYLKGQIINTVYIGGTPSLLSATEINQRFELLHKYHTISEDAEITLEANPDDLTQAYLKELRQTPINRLSIGIQSFNDADLVFMNRAHNAKKAKHAIILAKAEGFNNLTIDLIYGSPTTSDLIWASNLEKALAFDIRHISCYALTVEPKTALDHFIKTGQSKPVNEKQASRQFYTLIDTLTGNDFEHYEISNFGKPGFYSRHNTAYWQGTPYLGLGPAAHSFDGKSRRWNVANNGQYIKSINSGKIPFELEELSDADRFNEYLMTSLRTIWGSSSKNLEAFGQVYYHAFEKAVKPKLEKGLMIFENQHYKLSREGKFLADGIISDLFFV